MISVLADPVKNIKSVAERLQTHKIDKLQKPAALLKQIMRLADLKVKKWDLDYCLLGILLLRLCQ